MRVSVVAVGRPRPALAEAIREYEARAGRYWRFDAAEVRAARGRVAGPVLAREARAIAARVDPERHVVALTREGRARSSAETARWLGKLAATARSGVCFVVGGAFGLAEDALAACDERVRLSSLTLPHDVARLVLAEQLYRAGSILRGEPYHKGPG